MATSLRCHQVPVCLTLMLGVCTWTLIPMNGHDQLPFVQHGSEPCCREGSLRQTGSSISDSQANEPSRRQAAISMGGALGVLTVQMPVDAETEKQVASPMEAFLARTQAELGLTGGNSTMGNGNLTAVDSVSAVSLLVGLGIVALVVVPLLKLIAATATAIFVFGGFNGNDSKEDTIDSVVQNLLKQLSGEPPDALDEQRLLVTRLNDELTGMRAAVVEQADGKGPAELLRDSFRRQRFITSWRSSLAVLDIPEKKREKVDKLVKDFSAKETERRLEFKEARSAWIRSMSKKKRIASLWYRIRLGFLLSQKVELQSDLLKDLRSALPRKLMPRLCELLARRSDPSWLAEAGQPIHSAAAVPQQTIYVLTFNGDVSASLAGTLAKEISAILALPQCPTEVVLCLTSPGGTVTGYGLAAAQLMRLRQRGIRLVACVDQLAASGGYLMACCADHIACSPFAAIGSIGVISSTPNFAQRLEREGLKLIETTAGQWKTTVTPFKEPTAAELDKVKEDLGMVYNQFAGWVKERRPSVEVQQVATGEVWYGPRALKLGLVDELQTSAEYLLQRISQGNCEVFGLRYQAVRAGGVQGILGDSVDVVEALQGMDISKLSGDTLKLANALRSSAVGRDVANAMGGGRSWPAGGPEPQI